MQSDFTLPLGQCVKALPETFARLAPIFSHRDLSEVISDAEKADFAALRAARDFRFRINIALAAVFASAAFAAAAILVPGLGADWPDVASKWQRVLTACQFLSLGLAIGLFAWNVREGGREQWQKSRASAERLRLRQFRLLLEAPHPDPGLDTSELLSLKLEFLRQALLLPQTNYFRQRSKEAERRSVTDVRTRVLVILALTAVTMVAFVAGGLVLLSFTHTLPTWGAGVLESSAFAVAETFAGSAGTLALGWIAWSTGRASLFNHAVTASRLSETLRDLLALGGDEDEPGEIYRLAQSEAADGNQEAVQTWFSSLADILERDHREWLEEMEIGEQGGGDGAAIAVLIYSALSRRR